MVWSSAEKEKSMFERKELQRLREKAYDMADNYVKSTSWKRAFIALGDAANQLDAFIARTEIKETVGLGDENPKK